MKKIIKWIVIVIVLLILGGIVALYLSLDTIIKQTVEAQGTAQLNVPTTLDGVSLKLFAGTLDLSNLNIGSPQGFSSPQILSFGGLSVDTGGIMKLRDQPIHIPSIRIDQPKFVIEQSNGKINIKQLMDSLPGKGDQTPTSNKEAVPSAPATPAAKSQPIKLIIDDFTVNSAQVIVRPGLPGVAQEYDLTIPSLEIKNIGNADGNNNGAAIQDVVVALITQLTAKAAESGKLPPEVSAILSGNLDEIKAKAAAEAETQLNKAAAKFQNKIPANFKQPANDLMNQGLGLFKQASSKPSK